MNTDRAAARNEDLALALQHHTAGRLDEAEQIYQRLYAANRRDTEVIYLLGVLCCDLGLFEGACRFLEEALFITPAFPEARGQLTIALNGLADLKASSGLLDEAQRLLQKALESAPGDAQSLQGLGRVALMRGDAAAAEAWLVASLAQRGDHTETLNWLGLAQLQTEQYAASETSLRQALRLRPDLNQARNNLGLALRHQSRLGEAQTCFEEALAHDPAYQNARINLANTLRILGQHAGALRELDTVLAANPDAVDALNNRGAVLQDLGQADQALASLTRAIAISPSSPQVRWNLALTQLQLGDFQNGWSNFESRWEGCENLRGGYHMPVDRAWRGEALRGKRLLLWAEQGFGDTLQFVRFAQDAALRGATISVLAQPELADLVRSAPGVSAVWAQGGALPPYDFHCPLMSLPNRLGVSPDAAGLHGTTPYLFAATDRSEYWRQCLTAHPGIKVGLVWAGSSRRQSAELAAIDARRSVPLQRLAPILAVDGCSFYSLQKGTATVELDHRAGAAGRVQHVAVPDPIRNGAIQGGTIRFGAVHDYSAEWADFSDTAAFVANLDLVISVDTAVAHLAGALGKTVWLLNRHDTCWRWLRARSDSPWYATLRQFRQPGPGDWETPIATAAAALADVSGRH
ncbi:MAG TPA: tetratricopeptide repeat protein [Steroidobacteraceae bacterium]|nr:tetratricopeptide repeat protein [Steroidobacteraceae bacterium]